jgi:hypothetical protein
MLINIVLSVILLSNVSFETTYVKESKFVPESTVIAGMPPFNVSCATTLDGTGVLPVIFSIFDVNFFFHKLIKS